MQIDLIDVNGTMIARLISDRIEIGNAQDALEMIVNCGYRGARKLIINKENITPDFFDLRTGLAGEILLKFSNYQVKLAIVGDFSQYTSKNLKAFIYESNRMGNVKFVSSVDEAKAKLL